MDRGKNLLRTAEHKKTWLLWWPFQTSLQRISAPWLVNFISQFHWIKLRFMWSYFDIQLIRQLIYQYFYDSCATNFQVTECLDLVKDHLTQLVQLTTSVNLQLRLVAAFLTAKYTKTYYPTCTNLSRTSNGDTNQCAVPLAVGQCSIKNLILLRYVFHSIVQCLMDPWVIHSRRSSRVQLKLARIQRVILLKGPNC